MTVFFDARFIKVGRHDGISRFAANLFSHLSTMRDITAIISDEGQLQHLPSGSKFVLECPPTSIHELGIARRLNRLGASLVFSPMQTSGSFGKKFKLVLTLHDLIYYRHRKPPQEFSLLVRSLWRLYHLTYLPARLMLKQADALVTISHTSKKLIRQAKLFRGRIDVVYNAAEFTPSVTSRDLPSTKNLVYMGSFMEYKNVETLILGIQRLPEFELHLLSSIDAETKSRLLALGAEARSRIIFHNGVPDSQYRAILKDAFALVSASRDEGFGIPLIEAMAVGTPVICSDIEIFREIAADAAYFFNPVDPEQFASQVTSLGLSWQQASEKSFLNSKRFDWDASAKDLNDLLDSVLSK